MTILSDAIEKKTLYLIVKADAGLLE